MGGTICLGYTSEHIYINMLDIAFLPSLSHSPLLHVECIGKHPHSTRIPVGDVQLTRGDSLRTRRSPWFYPSNLKELLQWIPRIKRWVARLRPLPQQRDIQPEPRQSKRT